MNDMLTTKVDASPRGLHIALECDGKGLYEIYASEFQREIIIGRSRECTWNLAGIDDTVSQRHAIITRRRNQLYISDAKSKNGLYLGRIRIQERKLEKGDVISLGKCTIRVDEKKSVAERLRRYSQLEYMDYAGKKCRVSIDRPQMVIGSNPSCDIPIFNQLISAKHAVVTVHEDGSCWVKDMNSRNGTCINNEPLVTDSEHILHDNDVISIAYMDFRFLDAAVEHSSWSFWQAAMVLALILSLAVGGYLGYMKMRPSASVYLQKATEEIRNRRFDIARFILEKQVTASRDAANYSYERQQLLQQLTLWESVMSMWKSVKKQLSDGLYDEALRTLGSVDDNNVNAWGWPDGNEEKAKAVVVRALLQHLSAADSLLYNQEATIAEIDAIRKKITAGIVEVAAVREDFLQPLKLHSRNMLALLEQKISEDNELQRTLKMLDSEKPDYSMIITNLRKLQDGTNGVVSTRAKKTLAAAEALKQETARMDALASAVSAQDFQQVKTFAVHFPDGVDFSCEPRIGTLKKKLTDEAESLKKNATGLMFFYLRLKKTGIVGDHPAERLQLLRNSEVMKKVFECDCLDMPCPSLTQKDPCGRYDEILGIKFFYDYLTNVRTGMMTIMLEDLPFLPVLQEYREALQMVEKFIDFISRPQMAPFKKNAMEAFAGQCSRIVKDRDEFVSSLRKREGSLRERVIAKGMAAFLTENAGADNDALREETEKLFEQYRKEMKALEAEYRNYTPLEQINYRKQFILKGLPGDPLVKSKWNQRPAKGW